MWEYKTETFYTTWNGKKGIKNKFDSVLKEYSNQGWELVNFGCSDIGGILKIMVFKRKKQIDKS